jgi:hypothetical protein
MRLRAGTLVRAGARFERGVLVERASDRSLTPRRDGYEVSSTQHHDTVR